MDKRTYTSEDVADLAGVSQSTVSRVFAGNTRVSEKKRKKILEIAEKLGYQPNAIARGLSTRRTRLIGIVMRDFGNPFYPEVLSKFYSHLSRRGYHLIFINTEDEYIQEKEINQLIDYNVEGVIITDALLSSSEAQRFSRNKIAVTLFNRYIENSNSSAVFCDNYSGGRQIATYLVENGHRCFAFISGLVNTSTTIDRKRGFEEVLKERGISRFYTNGGDYSYESGYMAAQEIVSKQERVDCIFCANDIIAIGAMEGIRQMGLRIPDDISIIGFDDISIASWPSYSLTTWKYSMDELVEKTVELIIDEINGKVTEPKTIMLSGHLVIRNSVKRKK
jgi:DNA-binding LacI/PurR family transcriptional regulator